MSTDTQVRQLVEEWLRENYPNVDRIIFVAQPSGNRLMLEDVLTAFASHTRREALREAEEAVEHVIVETYSTAESVAAHKHLNQAAAAIRLLAEEKNDVEA